MAAPFDEIFIPAAADLQPGAQPVWALFDRNLDQPLIDLTAPPDWTTIYYFAQVSDDQESVIDGVRIVYRDSSDDGQDAIVPAEADINLVGRRMPGVVKVTERSGSSVSGCSFHSQIKSMTLISLLLLALLHYADSDPTAATTESGGARAAQGAADCFHDWQTSHS